MDTLFATHPPLPTSFRKEDENITMQASLDSIFKQLHALATQDLVCTIKNELIQSSADSDIHG